MNWILEKNVHTHDGNRISALQQHLQTRTATKVHGEDRMGRREVDKSAAMNELFDYSTLNLCLSQFFLKLFKTF